MEVKDIAVTLREITAADGKILANKDGDIIGTRIYLGKFDAPENYVEIDMPEDYVEDMQEAQEVENK